VKLHASPVKRDRWRWRWRERDRKLLLLLLLEGGYGGGMRTHSHRMNMFLRVNHRRYTAYIEACGADLAPSPVLAVVLHVLATPACTARTRLGTMTHEARKGASLQAEECPEQCWPQMLQRAALPSAIHSRKRRSSESEVRERGRATTDPLLRAPSRMLSEYELQCCC
jgi:hypothetical protein